MKLLKVLSATIDMFCAKAEKGFNDKFFDPRTNNEIKIFATPVISDNFSEEADGPAMIWGNLPYKRGTVIKVVGVNKEGNIVSKGLVKVMGPKSDECLEYVDSYTEEQEFVFVTNLEMIKGVADKNNIPEFTYIIVKVQKEAKHEEEMRVSGNGFNDMLTNRGLKLFKKVGALIFKNGNTFMKNVTLCYDVISRDLSRREHGLKQIHMCMKTLIAIKNGRNVYTKRGLVWGYPFFGCVGIGKIEIVDDLDFMFLCFTSKLLDIIFRDQDGDNVCFMLLMWLPVEYVVEVFKTSGVAMPAYKTRFEIIHGQRVEVLDYDSMSDEDILYVLGFKAPEEWRKVFDSDESVLKRLNALQIENEVCEMVAINDADEEIASTGNKLAR